MRDASIAPNRTHHRACPADAHPLAAPRSGHLESALVALPAPASGPRRHAARRLARATALGVGASVFLAGCAMLGGGREDEVPGLAPIEALATVETPWSTDAGSGIGRHWLVLAPAVAGGRVYVADARGRVSAWEAGSGRSVWRIDTDADITGGVGVGGGAVLVGTEDGEVIALRADTGAVAWRARLTSEVLSRPQAAGAEVIARTLDGKLFGLDAASGEVRWSYQGGVPALTVRGTGSPVVVASVTIAGFDNGRVAAVRNATGEVIWEAVVSDPRGTSELERLADVDTEPVVAGGAVYAASYERAVAAFEAETGRALWRRPIASRSGLAADADLLYVADTDGRVQALDLGSGATVWTEGSLAGREPAWPVVHGPFVAVVDVEGYVHWLRREDGRPVARTRSGSGRIAGPPAHHGDALIAYWGRGRLTAFTVR